MEPGIEYLPDGEINKATDEALRELLCFCFTKPQDVVFKTQRYFREPYRHRWIIRNDSGSIIAHVGVHEKRVESEERVYRIGGIAEVCVHPDYRGRGYVKMMLRRIHDGLSKQGFPFAVLFGDPRVYGSSGYVKVTNLFHGGDKEGWKRVEGMVKELAEISWPQEEVHLPGPKF